MKRTVINMIIILICSVAAGYLLLVAAFLIPQGRLYKGLANSVPVLERDSEDEMVFGYPSSRLDVFSDGAILNAAIHSNNEGPFKRAIACYQYIYGDLSRAQAFIAYFEPREPDGEAPYLRYWHGILVVLKPLFLFFNYSDIRMLNHAGQLILVCLCVYAFVKRGLLKYVPALLVAWFFLVPLTLPLSIQYSPVFYIGFASLTCLVFFYDTLKVKNRIIYLFLITGILTSYMDLLTYPMFTLGMPLTGFLIMEGKVQNHTFTGSIKSFILNGVSWGSGYAGMWAGKILISIPFYGVSAITDAADNIQKRSAAGAIEEGITYADAITANFFMYKNSIFKVCLIVYTLVMAVYLVYLLIRKKGKPAISELPLYLIAGLIPFAWYMVTREHAQIHAFMTYKNLAVSVFAYCAMLAAISGKGSRAENIKEA